MSARTAGVLCARFYRWLARAFPEEFRSAHGSEMTQVSEELIHEAAADGGWIGLLPMAGTMLWDLCVRLIAEHTIEFKMNVRHGARMLMASPGFTLVAVLSLGFGIGLAATIFAEYQSMVFRPVPAVADPMSLVTTLLPVSEPYYQAFRDSGEFDTLAGYTPPVPFLVREVSNTQRVWGQVVTPNYFSVLGAKCESGRLLGGSDGEGNVDAVISDRLWRHHFGGNVLLLGSTIRLNGQGVTVVGIAGSDFLGASPMIGAADIWLTTTAASRLAPELDRTRLRDGLRPSLRLVGRLRPHVDKQQAEVALDAIARRLDQRFGKHNESKAHRVPLYDGGFLIPLRKQDLPLLTGFPAVMVGLTLWIAFANVATMLLARAVARRREIAIRLSLGASRGRIIRQLLTETSLLSLLGAMAGLGFTVWSARSFEALLPMMPGFINVSMGINWVTFLFAAAVAVGSGLLFGLAPALQATRADIAPDLKAGAAPRLRGYRWFSSRNLLVLQQVAGSVALLLLTGFIVLGFQRSTSMDVGYDPRGLFSMTIDPMRDGYTSARAAELVERLRRRAQQMPGIEGMAAASGKPAVISFGSPEPVKLYEKPDQPVVQPAVVDAVSTGYLETFGVPMLAGRSFQNSDQREGAAAVIVNEALAREFGSGTEALGKTLEVDEHRYQVIGISKDIHTGILLQKSVPGLYLPLTAAELAKGDSDGITLVVRGAPGIDVPAAMRGAVEGLDPTLAIFSVLPMTEHIRQVLYVVKTTTLVYGSIGLFGLILAAIGLGGVTAYSVAQRRKEIGIRMALGASRFHVLKLVLREGAVLIFAGAAIGQFGAWGIAAVLKSYISSISEVMKTSLSDPMLTVGAPVLLAALTMIACYLPARRSIRVDPTRALREE